MVTEVLLEETVKYLTVATAFTGQATGGFPTAGWECQAAESLLLQPG